MKALDINNVDKTNWKKFRFEEIASSISERVEPSETDLDIYVGLEHLDAESLHIKRTGVPSDVSGTKLKVYKGDLIFGKRRAYQRKASIAHFDGICSAHAMVLRAKEKVMDPKLFPFFIHSDYFMHRAIDISVGGLSPTINWGTLKNQEFLLPPKDQQYKLAELLWAADELVEKYFTQLISLENLLQINVESTIWNNNYKKSEIKNIVAKDVGGFVDGDWIESKDQSESGIRLIQLADIGVSEFIDKSRRFISEETFKRLKCFELIEGDLLIARMPDPLGRSCLFPDIKSKAITAVDVCIVRIDTKNHNSKYWEYAFNSKSWFELMNIYASGTTRTRISKKNLQSLKLPFPNKVIQDEIVEKLLKISNAKQATKIANEIQQGIQKQLINQIFS